MHLLDVLGIHGFDSSVPARMVRHAESDRDLEVLVRAGLMDDYQARQGKDRFASCRQLVSFIGERGSRSRFLGVYQVEGCTTDVPPWPAGFPFPDVHPGTYYYDLRKLPQYAELEGRLVIDWGDSTRSWVQKVRARPVIELLPTGHMLDFPGYEEVQLSYDELRTIVSHREANRDWHTALASVAGVYLISDGVDGNLYVGSASGESGLFGRWAQYAKTPHGGNKLLRELLDKHPDRHHHFTYSILRTLPRSMTQKEVVAAEQRYKQKLGKRACMLNGN